MQWLRPPEGREAGQGPPAVWDASLLPGGFGAGGVSTHGSPIEHLCPFLSNLGLEFCHELIKVLAATRHFPALVDGVDLRRTETKC